MLAIVLPFQSATPPPSLRKEVRLGHREILKIETWGGEKPGKCVISLTEDGTLTVKELDRGHPIKPVVKKLSKDEVTDLEARIQTEDFEKLWSGPKATVDPQSVDGVDELYVMRQGKRIVWWSNSVFQTSDLEANFVQYIWAVIHS